MSPTHSRSTVIATTFLPVLLAVPTAAAAQQVAPPKAQAWIDVLERLNFDMDLERELVSPTTLDSTEVAA